MRSYTRLLLLLSTLLLVGNTLLVLFADPLNLFGLARLPGVNAFKNTYSDYTRIAKPIQVEWTAPQRLALGSSRAELGLRTSNEAWAQAYPGTGFNAALSGASIGELHDSLAHAIHTAKPRSVVLGIDFFMFSAGKPTRYAYPQLLAGKDDGPIQPANRRLEQLRLALFSPAMTRASIRTLRKQKPIDDEFHLDGQRNNQRELLKLREDGYERAFVRFEEGFAHSTWTACQDNRFSYGVASGNTLTRYQDLLRMARDADIDLKIFISPVHARLLETLDATELWPAFERWKRDIVAATEHVNAEVPAGRRLEVVDFSGYHRYSMEPLPLAPNEEMHWYLDSSHYHERLGDQMLQQLFTGLTGEDGQFGVALDGTVLDAHLARIRSAQTAYREAHPGQQQRLRARAQEQLEQRRRSGERCLAPGNLEDQAPVTS
ncbi:hypothetical protein ACUTAH_15045 [Metapseudomonas furukawaii]|uniref:hypothetical protein n=1 Tax=Metapseudomonas furukawaii TaxID=1149133 RepID=UPI00404619D5